MFDNYSAWLQMFTNLHLFFTNMLLITLRIFFVFFLSVISKKTTILTHCVNLTTVCEDIYTCYITTIHYYFTTFRCV